MENYDPKVGVRVFGRFRVHPDKVLLRIYPIKGETKVGDVTLWLPPSAKRREATHRYARVLQIGDRLIDKCRDFIDVNDIVMCHNYADTVYGMAGKFKLGGKYVCVTMLSEILCKLEYEQISELGLINE